MDNSFHVITLNFKKAELAIREQFSLSDVHIEHFYQSLKDVLQIEEALFVGTCNRIELYCIGKVSYKEIIGFICGFNARPIDRYSKYFEALEGEEAIRHLFRVSVGMESQVLGDLEIYGQVKKAYQTSVDLGMSGPFINRLLHQVFSCHKAIKQHTEFKNGATSISYNAIKVLSEKEHVGLNASILVIGTGQMGSAICKNLVQKGYDQVSITNRTELSAYELSEELPISFIPYFKHRKQLKTFDVVICAIACETPQYFPSDFNQSGKTILIDVSAPRSIDEGASTLGGHLYNIDDLGGMVDEVIIRRKEEIPKVEVEIDRSVSDYLQWVQDSAFSDQLKKFKATLTEIQHQSMAAMMKKMNESERKVVEEVTCRMINKIIKLPVLHMKSMCKRNEIDELSESLNELFNIELVNKVKS